MGEWGEEEEKTEEKILHISLSIGHRPLFGAAVQKGGKDEKGGNLGDYMNVRTTHEIRSKKDSLDRCKSQKKRENAKLLALADIMTRYRGKKASVIILRLHHYITQPAASKP